jgi:prolyl oligopeptidase
MESPVTLNLSDPHLWLEDVLGEKSLAWVRARNAESTGELTPRPGFESLRQRLLQIYDSKEQIPYVTRIGSHLYNFWQDDRQVRGLFRRTSLEEYRSAHPHWEPVLDLDQLSADEKENWVWKGYQPLFPTYDRCLISLSRGGADATEVREFDLVLKTFVDGGFRLPEAKTSVTWRDRDTLYVGTDFGPGSLTHSGYPRQVKEWTRGTPLSEATLLFEGQPEDVAVRASVIHDRGYTYARIDRSLTFFTSEIYLLSAGRWEKIDKPLDATLGTFGDQWLFTLRSDWTVGGQTHPAGALLSVPADEFLKGNRGFVRLFEPSERKSLVAVTGTRNHLFVNELENVRNRIYVLTRTGREWHRQLLQTPGPGTVAAWGVDPDESNHYWLVATDFLLPSGLYLGTVGEGPATGLKSLPPFFNAQGLRIEQFEAVSRDGTRIPYFQISRKHLALEGQNATLLYGYGGFEVSLLSTYDPTVGAAWLEYGGVYVQANIRGGGEFGPLWHQAALKQNRQTAYDDFIAVAEDLIRRRVTSPDHLGILGASNGGLLVGNILIQRPDLLNAVVCAVPLLDMKRYPHLLAGASWMGEYGDPDRPEDWAFLQRYSPYHNVQAGRNYPQVLFTTSTRDDRVHPGHARKMAARMREQGHVILYYENLEGGHGGAADHRQRAFMRALEFTFLRRQLGLESPPPIYYDDHAFQKDTDRCPL